MNDLQDSGKVNYNSQVGMYKENNDVRGSFKIEYRTNMVKVTNLHETDVQDRPDLQTKDVSQR